MLSMQDWYRSKSSKNLKKEQTVLVKENQPVNQKMLEQSTLASADTPATMNVKLKKQIANL